MARSYKNPPLEKCTIESLNYDGRAVTHIDGKTVYIAGALPGEVVTFYRNKKHQKYDEATVAQIITASQLRVKAKCQYFDKCGGCSLQILDSEAQIHFKLTILKENLKHIGKLTPVNFAPVITGKFWNYRRKARLGVHYDPIKDLVYIGFRKKLSSKIVIMDSCEILPKVMSEAIPELKKLIYSLALKDKIPQIEFNLAKQGPTIVLRHLQEMTTEDKNKCINFAIKKRFNVFLQGTGTRVTPLYPKRISLSYILNNDIEIHFRPLDFIQVNEQINNQLINLTNKYLNLKSNDNLLDLFCGIGNFSLPLSKNCNSVIGIDGDKSMVEIAKVNAINNNINNISFFQFDLFVTDKIKKNLKLCNKLLLDPPRNGAWDFLFNFNIMQFEIILYISCNPATFARDAALITSKGFIFETCGVMDMFPHTSHVESFGLFRKANGQV